MGRLGSAPADGVAEDTKSGPPRGTEAWVALARASSERPDPLTVLTPRPLARPPAELPGCPPPPGDTTTRMPGRARATLSHAAAAVALALVVSTSAPGHAVDLPAGFLADEVARGITGAVAMA